MPLDYPDIDSYCPPPNKNAGDSPLLFTTLSNTFANTFYNIGKKILMLGVGYQHMIYCIPTAINL